MHTRNSEKANLVSTINIVRVIPRQICVLCFFSVYAHHALLVTPRIYKLIFVCIWMAPINVRMRSSNRVYSARERREIVCLIRIRACASLRYYRQIMRVSPLNELTLSPQATFQIPQSLDSNIRGFHRAPIKRHDQTERIIREYPSKA